VSYGNGRVSKKSSGRLSSRYNVAQTLSGFGSQESVVSAWRRYVVRTLSSFEKSIARSASRCSVVRLPLGFEMSNVRSTLRLKFL